LQGSARRVSVGTVIKALYKTLWVLLGAIGAVVAGKVSGRAGKRVDGEDTAPSPKVEEAGRRHTEVADLTPAPAAPRPHSEPVGRTRDQLYDEARRKGIKGRSKMSKADLEAALDRAEDSPESS